MKQILQYRLHLILLTALLTLAPFRVITLNEVMIALAMGMVIAWAYLFNKTTDLIEDNINTASYPIDVNYRSIIRRFSFACLIIPMFWLWQTPEIFAVYLIFGGLLGFLYSYPIPIGKKHYRLKNILLIKNLTSALTWATCTCMPYYLLYPDSPPIYSLVQGISVFIVMVCVEIVWDIRDVDGDKRAGVRTLPNTIGIPASRAITVVVFLGYCFWVYGQFPHGPPRLLVLAQGATFLTILCATKTRPYWYFHLPVLIWTVFYLVGLIQKV